MKKRDESRKTAAPSTESGKALRLRAEEKVARLQGNFDDMSPEDIRKVLHELQVHQIELEMQNEELRRAQTALDTSRARYFELYDLAPVGYLTISKKGLILEANLTLATLLGMPRNVLAGQPISSFIPKEDQDIYYLHRKRLFESGRQQICEMRMLKKDGTVFWGQMNAAVAQGTDGEQVCRVTVNDITERKNQELQIKESDELHRTILRTSMDGVYILDMQGRLLDVNEAYCLMSGYSEQELLSMRISDIDADVSDTDVEVRIRKITEQGHAGFEARHRRRDGSFFDVEASVTYLPLEGGRMVAFMRDITDRKRAEADLVESAESLRVALSGTIQALSMTVEMRDPYTAGHQRRVADLAGAIAGEMGMDEERANFIHLAGSIHDIAKISIPAEILSKPGKLSESEFNLIKTHPQTGYEILKDIEFPLPIAEIILQHHERLDGSGYPNGLKGEEIMPEARIMSVADVVEAMASHRPYRATLGLEAALEEIEKNKGVLYGPAVVDACLRLFREKDYHFVEANP